MTPVTVNDDEPDPRCCGAGSATRLRPWIGWILIGAAALLMLIGLPRRVTRVVAGQADPVPRVGRHRRHLPRRPRRVLPRHAGDAQRQRSPRPARADGRRAAPGAADRVPTRRASTVRRRPHREAGAGAAAQAWSCDGGQLFHRGDCALIVGKDTTETTPAAAKRRGLKPCPACAPVPVAARN